ncbi:putative ankyrin repeat domain-containing protein [Wolbachia endosymbiont of Cylisticus convexus]|uniref:hypothetical protein n=1 Tax=Wolbachia endosymbiont of Cylisticus convexus TaxID=118728 RepID=UPI000E1658C3|nr:hypothetical protein [Wolbachia endosymbiont of Cylisticus convexus]RDD35512.1 putative ankyrin repeat domain-containing protein [Wolbachia endosymbiont of Cylisticus convexus]
MNLNQQLLIDLHDIEVNIIKKEKNFDFRTALISLFKALYKLFKSKQDISKKDLANAAEKESRRLGLEGRYNWNEMFDLEKEATEKAEKQGDKEQKLNKIDNFYVGQAISNGSCFFDSFRHSLKQQTGIQVTVEQLRTDCKRFSQNNPPEWFRRSISHSYDNNGQRRNENLNAYAANIMSNNRWGDPEVEGRILCEKYGVKLHIVESNPWHTTDKQQDQFLHQLIGSSGSKNVGEYNRVNYTDNSVLHIVNRGHAHFEPLLNRNKILAKQTQEQQDFLLAKQLQEREDYSLAMKLQKQEYAKRLQGQEYAQSLNPRCSMEEVKIEDQQQQILVK